MAHLLTGCTTGGRQTSLSSSPIESASTASDRRTWLTLSWPSTVAMVPIGLFMLFFVLRSVLTPQILDIRAYKVQQPQAMTLLERDITGIPIPILNSAMTHWYTLTPSKGFAINLLKTHWLYRQEDLKQGWAKAPVQTLRRKGTYLLRMLIMATPSFECCTSCISGEMSFIKNKYHIFISL